MNRTPAVIASFALVLFAIGFSWPVFAYTGDDPVLATGVAACYFKDIQAHIGPSGSVTYKVYGNCAGSIVSGQMAYSDGKFQESFIISNQGKIRTVGYCDTDPWATAVNCHDQKVHSSSINYDPGLARSAPLSLINGGQAFHEAFLHASRPNPPGMPVNFSATADFGQMTARWIAPDDSGDRPYLGFLVQVQPHDAAGAAWTDFGRIGRHTKSEYLLPGKLPPLSSTVKAWDARVCAVTQLAQTCTPALLPGSSVFREVAEVNKEHGAAAALLQPDPAIASAVAESDQSIAAATALAQPAPTPAIASPASPDPAPTMALGRVQITTPSDPNLTICDHARSARARNSPAAPGLERQCTASGGSFAPLAPPPPPH